MLSKIVGFITIVLVAFGLSLLLIPTVGIVFGLLKSLLKALYGIL